MKTNKLNLTDLKIKSFVTGLDEEKSKTAKGGTSAITFFGCPGSQGCIPHTMNSNPACQLH